jgi:hypothetical protein
LREDLLTYLYEPLKNKKRERGKRPMKDKPSLAVSNER